MHTTKKTRLLLLALVLTLLLSVVAGCAQKSYLTIEGEKISKMEFDFYLKNAVSSYLYDNQVEGETIDLKTFLNEEKDDKKNSEIIIDNAIDSIKETRVIDKKFSELSLLFSLAELKELDEQAKQFVQTVGGEVDYKKYLSTLGISDELFKQILERDYKTQKIMDKIFAKNSKYEVLPRDMQAYFEENYYRMRHILLATTDEAGKALSDEEKANKKTKLEEIRARILAGEDFSKLADEYDEDTEHETYKSGYVFAKKEMPDEFYEAIKNLKVGDVSEVFETSVGYHLLKLEDKNESESIYDAQKENIAAYIKDERFTELKEAWMESLSVERDDAALSKIKLEKFV